MGAEEIYWEYESGTKVYRKELGKVLSHIQQGDTLVTTEVSRLTRSVKQLCEMLELAKSKKFKLVIGDFIIDCSKDEISTMTEAMLMMMAVFSEMERRMTIDRIKSGLAHARAKGVRLGRPKATPKDLPSKVMEMWPIYKRGFLSKTDYANVCGVSRPTIYKYIAMLTDS